MHLLRLIKYTTLQPVVYIYTTFHDTEKNQQLIINVNKQIKNIRND